MGLFGNKKHTTTPASVLSESEIQKKLYGEFNTGGHHPVIGEREHVKETTPLSSRRTEFSPKREGASDLFSSSGETATESVSRSVPSRPVEKNTPSLPLASSGSDPYARFRYNQPAKSRAVALLDLFKKISEKGGELLRTFLDPRHVVLRRVIYWGTAGLLVFLLFWGVNTLNSQREIAMRTRYKIPAETASLLTTAQAPVVASSGVVTERSVTITPVSVKPKKDDATSGSGTTVPQEKALYVIQIVTYPNREDANQIVSALRREGFRAYVRENTRPSGRLFYLVQIGTFRTEAEAQAQLSKFRAKDIARPFQDAFVKTNRS